MNRQVLDLSGLADAIEQLLTRIVERFPESGLRKNATLLLEYARELERDRETLVKVPGWIRLISWLGGFAVVGFIFLSGVYVVKTESGIETLPNFLQALSAVITVFAGATAGFFTMRSIEQSQVRRLALSKLQFLREMAHVIDMLQLSKSPVAIMFPPNPLDPADATRSHKPILTPKEMFQYLSYCGELSALIGKLAVIFIGWVHDPTLLATIDDVEDLCSDLERKMLSKLLLIEQLHQRLR
ncbi:MAG: hypothetical protein K8R92_04055 [Planctomycetes bacterium]|nr:hypothetical protein [Planctomycetota bacterium]